MMPLSSSFVHLILPPAPFFRAPSSVHPSVQLLSHHHRRSSPSSLPTSTPTSIYQSDGYGYGSGLTDDGDFAILGINASSDDDEDDDESGEGRELRKEFDRGSSIGSLGVGNMLFDESLLRSGRVCTANCEGSQVMMSQMDDGYQQMHLRYYCCNINSK